MDGVFQNGTSAKEILAVLGRWPLKEVTVEERPDCRLDTYKHTYRKKHRLDVNSSSGTWQASI